MDRAFKTRSRSLMQHFDARPGEHVVDFGMGPGHLSTELAGIVGPSGRVIGIDVNADFVTMSRGTAAAQGLSDRTEFHVVAAGERWPLADASVDRVIFKNVLEYVPSVAQSLAEALRVLRPGGVVKVSDSDWGFVIAEPLTAAEVGELYTAAGGAFKDPNIGRHLPAALRAAGFVDGALQVRAAPNPGQVGLVNMFKYAVQLGAMAESRAAELRGKVQRAVADGTFYMVLPQFYATAVKPPAARL